MITHYDLFAGIGGFSLALEEVYPDEAIRHIFCEWDNFPSAVLRRHWPDGEFYGDIAELVTDTSGVRRGEGLHSAQQGRQARQGHERRDTGATADATRPGLEDAGTVTDTAGRRRSADDFTIVTGGFPCQPFSHAGRRKGTADDRYQWPNMFAVIRNVSPEWVIAENVRGLVTWSDGLVLETVCADLESQNYEVQPIIIPAVAVGAPHKRDRVWIIAHSLDHGQGRAQPGSASAPDSLPQVNWPQHSAAGQPGRADSDGDDDGLATDAESVRQDPGLGLERQPVQEAAKQRRPDSGDWGCNWQEVALATCDESMVNGLPRIVDGVPYSYAKWRQASLKAYGNGIVHQVATQIIRSIKESMS